jgi:hypothetical protein
MRMNITLMNALSRDIAKRHRSTMGAIGAVDFRTAGDQVFKSLVRVPNWHRAEQPICSSSDESACPVCNVAHRFMIIHKCIYHGPNGPMNVCDEMYRGKTTKTTLKMKH